MKTNFDKKRYLVLASGESKIMAIIECEKGIQDITEKVKIAIRESECFETVEIINDFILKSTGAIHIVKTEVSSFKGDEPYTEYYNLFETAIY